MGKRILSIAMCLVLACSVILSDAVTSNAQSEGAFNRVKFKGKRIVKDLYYHLRWILEIGI